MSPFSSLLCMVSSLFAVIAFTSGHVAPTGFLPKPQFDGRIVGGNAISIKQAPWQVSLQRSSHFCGGSIIGATWILTAAHCTTGQNANLLNVRLGSSTHASNGQLVKVKRIVQHEQFNYANIDYDFSLLELHEPLQFDETKQPIDLPDDAEHFSDGTLCEVTGWGNTQNSSESRNHLRAAYVPIVKQKKCSKAYREYGGVTPRMICAGFDEGGKDACQGDSGGPLVCKSKLTGIVSWGYGCAKPNYPGVYSRVQAARRWIRQKAGI